MSRDKPSKNVLEEKYDATHTRTFTVDVPAVVRIEVKGYDSDDIEDLSEKVESAIAEMCEALYHNKATSFFVNMERDENYSIEVKNVE